MAPYLNGGAARGDTAATEPEPLCQIVAPTGAMGYGFIEHHVLEELERLKDLPTPTAIILDSGSTDSGPSRLALGHMNAPRSSYERDLGILLKAVVKYKVPLLVGSIGGDGADEHVDLILDIIKDLSELPENKSWKLKILAIYSGVSHKRVSQRLETGQITGCGPAVPELTQADIDVSPRVVGQMGPEPYLDAMFATPDFNVIIGGRAYDPAPFIAFTSYHYLKRQSRDMESIPKEVLGAFVHMGKILECGGQCATPKGPGAAAYVYKDASFDVVPLNPEAKCFPVTVAAHCLYEKSHPDFLHGPGGYLDLRNAKYEQLKDDRTVRVRGSIFSSSRSEGKPYTVKLEAGKLSGYRSMAIGSWCDPQLLSQASTLKTRIKEYVQYQHQQFPEKWDLEFHIYGLDENWKPGNSGQPYHGDKGVFVVVEAMAETQALATSLANTARIACIHAPYEGQKATSGNFGFGIGGKMELECGPCASFSLYHLMNLAEGEEGAFFAESHEAGVANTQDGKPLFHWTEGMYGKGEEEPLHEANGEAQAATIKKSGYIMPAMSPLAVPESPKTLSDVAYVVRSKNAGPYEITIDVLFSSPEIYKSVRDSGVLTPKILAKLYNLSLDEIIYCGFFDPALAFKATWPRKRNGKNVPSGGWLETDMHGSQQYMPLLKLPLGVELVSKLEKIIKASK